jgi:hypothetical protein
LAAKRNLLPEYHVVLSENMELLLINTKNMSGVCCDQNSAKYLIIRSPLVKNEVIVDRGQLLAEVSTFDIADTLNESLFILVDVEQICAVPRKILCIRWELVKNSHRL